MPNLATIGLSSKEAACNTGDIKCRKHGFDPWVRKIPLRKKWQPTSVFLPGKSHEQRELGGATVYGVAKEPDTTERLNRTSGCQYEKMVAIISRS